MITEEKNDKYRNHVRLFLAGLWCLLAGCASCDSQKFGISDLEKTRDARALLAICYRAQKDQNATAGGNTRNCDDIAAEAIRFVRHQSCTESIKESKEQCFCAVYNQVLSSGGICQKR